MISSVVKLKDLYRHLRFDAEFYQPEYLRIETLLKDKKTTFPLRKYCMYIKKGIFDISPELYTDKGVPLIRTSEIKNPLVNFSTTVFLEPLTHKDHIKTELKPSDIVMTKIGAYIGDVALLPTNYERYNFSQNVTGLKINQKSIKAKYLFSYLISKFGRLQINRIIMLSGQGKIELEDIRDLWIYEASDEFQNVIEETVKASQIYTKNSEIKFIEAQEIILSELGLINWQPKHQLSFIKNYSDTVQAGRIDAEYYQPKYEDIVKAIKRYSGGWDTLGNLVKIKDKNYTLEAKKQYQYIELANITGNGEVAGCMCEEGQDLPSRARRRVLAGDIIVSSIEGSLSSIALIEQEYGQALCSTGFHVINSKEINSETLLVLLKCVVGQLQLKKGCSGTILTAINKEQFSRITLPKIEVGKQAEIKQKVTESFNLRKKSKHLLDCSKKAVEMAIEQNEKTAIDWLKKQVEE